MANQIDNSNSKDSLELNEVHQAKVSVRCLIIGPEGSGKTALVSALIKRFRAILGQIHFKSSSILCISRAMQYHCEGSFKSLILADLPGNLTIKSDMFQMFKNVNLVCYCYSIDGCFSLSQLSAWIKEINKICPGVPSILVACKTDLRGKGFKEAHPPNQIYRLMPTEKGMDFKKKHGIDKFYEFSEQDSPEEVNKILEGMFELVSRKTKPEASSSRRNEAGKCCFLL